MSYSAANPHALLEEAWFGAEFRKHQPNTVKAAEETEPGFGTGAFKMQGPDLASVRHPSLQGKVPAKLPYATDSKKVDACLAKERRVQDTAALKAKQLIRNGLVTRITLTPILALPNGLTEAEQNRRRNDAAARVENYKYESSGDEFEDSWMARQEEQDHRRTAAAARVERSGYESSGDESEDSWVARKPAPRARFANLKKALARLEQPPPPSKAAKALKRKAIATSSASNGEEQQPSKRSRLNEGNHASDAQQVT